jgi:hypothetical protein
MVAAAFLLALLGLLVAGCSDGLSTVSGKVTVDGTPAEKGSISFIPADGATQTTGGEIKDGKYSFRAPRGKMKVQVRVPKVVGKKKLYPTSDSPIQDILAEVLPAKYNDKTELLFDVQPGKNEKDWDLKTR